MLLLCLFLYVCKYAFVFVSVLPCLQALCADMLCVWRCVYPRFSVYRSGSGCVCACVCLPSRVCLWLFCVCGLYFAVSSCCTWSMTATFNLASISLFLSLFVSLTLLYLLIWLHFHLPTITLTFGLYSGLEFFLCVACYATVLVPNILKTMS